MAKSFDEIRKSLVEKFAHVEGADALVGAVVEAMSQQAFETEIIRRRLMALETLLKSKDTILARYGEQPRSRLAKMITIEAREAVLFDGFHELEYAQDGLAFRWTGPSNVSRFVAWLDRSAHTVARLEILEGGDRRNLTQSSLIVDGVSYAFGADIFPNTLVTGKMHACELNGPTELLLHVPYTVRPGERGEDDGRVVGMKIQRLELSQVDG
jgi:hypothetical protein